MLTEITYRRSQDHHTPEGWSIALEPDVRISIKKLLRLHDDWKEDELHYEDRPTGVVAAQGLVQVHSHYAGQSVWREWCSRELKVGDLDIRRLKRNLAEYKKE